MKKSILIILAFSWVGFALANNKDGETRTAVATYDISANDVVNLQAKYTDVTIETWNESSVEITATVRFDGKINDRMQTFLDNFQSEVESNITDGTGELLIKTNLDEPNKFQLGSKNVGIIIGFNEDELKLDYKIRMPASNKLIVKNSYRDLLIRGAFSEVEIDQYSGDLEGESIEKADIKLKYGSATFKSLGTVKMELYEQELQVGIIKELNLNTKYSELNIRELGPTKIESYESDFEIGTLTSLEGDLKYGKMEITQTLVKGNLKTYEFDIEAKNIEQLIIISKYGEIEAGTVKRLGLTESYEDNIDIEVLGSLISENTKYGEYRIGKLTSKFELIGYEDDVFIDDFSDNATEIDISGKYILMRIETNDRAYKLIADTKYGKMDIDRDNMNVTRYIKDGDQLEIEASSTTSSASPLVITIKGYEMKLELD